MSLLFLTISPAQRDPDRVVKMKTDHPVNPNIQVRIFVKLCHNTPPTTITTKDQAAEQIQELS